VYTIRLRHRTESRPWWHTSWGRVGEQRASVRASPKSNTAPGYNYAFKPTAGELLSNYRTALAGSGLTRR